MAIAIDTGYGLLASETKNAPHRTRTVGTGQLAKVSQPRPATQTDNTMIHPHAPPATHSQSDLFDHGEQARQTRAIAAASATPKGPSRRDRIESYILSRGAHGATRHEIADAMGWPLSGVCSPVKAMLRSGRLAETGQRRLTQYGSMAAVIVCTGARTDA